MSFADIYAAECECARLECLSIEADNAARRLRLEYAAAVQHLRELVRHAAESKPRPVEPEDADPALRTRSMLDLLTEDSPR